MAILENIKKRIGEFFAPIPDKVRPRDILREVGALAKGILKPPEDPEEALKLGMIPISFTEDGKVKTTIDLFGFVGGIKRVGGKILDETTRTLVRSPAFAKHFRWFREISAPERFRPPIKGKVPPGEIPPIAKEAIEKKIALRVTKGGVIVPAVRKAGPFVSEEFATYKNFKDVNPGAFGGTKDITRLIQEIDGALPVRELVQLPGQVGPLSKNVLFRTRDVIRQSIGFANEMNGKLVGIVGTIKKGSRQAFTANRVLERISSADKVKSIEELLKRNNIKEITTNPEIVRLAKEARVYFDDILDMQNLMRTERNQKLIPKREFYSPNELRDRSLFEKTFGLKKQPVDIIQSPQLPDYIHPDKPFNPRELAREFGLPEFAREMDLVTLLDNYTRTAIKDIFSTSIIQNNKAFIQQLETMGFRNSARSLENWTAESFAGVKAQVDRAANLAPAIEKGMRWWRQRLVRSVFPLNFSWNMFVQTSSVGLTGTRYGWINTGKSSIEWFTNPTVRKEIADNAYSFIVKTQRVGRISQQDINIGIVKAKDIQRGKMERAVDAANFLTEAIERHLTGISVRAAFNDGARRGLKGKSLWEYASDGGGKTQSMYNMEDLPGILRSNIVKTAAPFQTFSFEIFNTMREFAGRTGVPPGTFQERMKWVLNFFAGAYVANTVGEMVNGRKPWQASSFIPFYGNFVTPILSDRTSETVRGLPSFIGVGRDIRLGIENVIEKDNWTKLRQITIRFGLPFGGTQISRVVDGIIAISKQGVEDSSGRLLFPIVESKEQMRALLLGPFKTEAGKEFLEKRGLK